MLDEKAILDTNDVRRNPVHRLAEARKSPVHDHKIFVGHNRSRFILQRRRDALDELKEAVTTRFDMGAVLDVVGRPIALSRCVVSNLVVTASLRDRKSTRLNSSHQIISYA